MDDALQLYSSFEDFDPDDLGQTLNNIIDEVKKLPQLHSELWDIFKTIINKKDAEAYQQFLKDEAIRVVFYNTLLAFFLKLRRAVLQRYFDDVDYRQDDTVLKSISTDIAIAADDIIRQHIVVDWQFKIDVPKRMFHLIGDYLIDEVRDKYHLQMTFNEIDGITERIVDVAKIRYKK